MTVCAAMQYSQAFRQKLVQKMMGPHARSATALSAEVGIPQPTLSRWLREAHTWEAVSKSKPKKSPPTKKWPPQEKLRVVHETSTLSEEELGEYLRREGVREGQLAQWREALEGAVSGTQKKAKASPEAKRLKELERELRRKDKALAEVSALLLLSVFCAINLALLQLRRMGPVPEGAFSAPGWVPATGAALSGLALIWGVTT